MFRFCLLYGFLLLVTGSTEKDVSRKVPISNGKTKATGEVGYQVGPPEIHISKGVLKDGTPTLDLKCSSKSTETSVHSFAWTRKGPGKRRYNFITGMSPKIGFSWPYQNAYMGWLKHKIIEDKNMVDGEYNQGGIVSFTLRIPLEPCEDEGLFKCTHYFQKDKKTSPLEKFAVFRFNKTLVCGKSTGPQSSKDGPSDFGNLLKEENVSYANLAIEELAAIIVLVLILIVTIICCVRRRKNANKTKNEKEKKSDANLKTKRKPSRSRTRTSHSRHLNSKSHLSSHRQPSYSTTDPANHSPRPNKTHISPYQSMTRMNGPPPPIGGPPQSMGGPPLPPPIGGPPQSMGGPPLPPPIGGPPQSMGGPPLPPPIGGPPQSMGGPPLPPPIGGPPQSMGGPPLPPPIGGPPQSMGGPSSPPNGPPPQNIGGSTGKTATARPDRNAFLASINARRASSSNL
ncbi:protein CHUP1, chloroplastic-like [Pecten maximus]|uniref:protein CHUP1, chloroplastic-like n=1 Tax=Pecten maximus TaxID=6579 RepID=UPI0014586A5F|nr:protein CHUP1, chloroplastic-like [Pecten maximus]